MEFLDREPIMTRIDELRNTVVGSAILASKQHRLKVLLDDIAKYRYHEQAILRRMAKAVGETEISFTLIQLAWEELFSQEQYLILAQLVNQRAHDWRGIKIPTKKTARSMVWTKVAAVLEELLLQKGLSHERYTSIKEDNGIQ